MNLEKHAKALIEYPASSDDDDYPNYKMKALKYRKDYHESYDKIQKLKLENQDNKQMIQQIIFQFCISNLFLQPNNNKTFIEVKSNILNKPSISGLLEDLENYRKRVKTLDQQLLNQKQLTQDSQEQLRRVKQQKQEERLLMEQKQFQEKLTLQTNNAIEKLRQHFDQTLQQLTPKTDNRR